LSNEKKKTPPKFYVHQDAEIRGDKIYVTCRKPDDWVTVRRTGQHNAFEAVIRKDARAKILQAYTNNAEAKA